MQTFVNLQKYSFNSCLGLTISPVLTWAAGAWACSCAWARRVCISYQLLHGHLHLPRLVVTGGAAHGARQLQGGSHVGLHILHVDFGDLLLRLLDHCLKINIIICKTGTENFYVHCTPYSCLHTTGCHCTLVLYSAH